MSSSSSSGPPESKPVIADLRRERRGANFDIWDLTEWIYGGKKQLAEVERQTRLVMSEPRLQGDDLWWVSRPERYMRACERGRLFVELVRKHKIPFEERGPLEALLGEDLFVLLHDVMFVPSLMNLADAEQQEWWLNKALNYEILGTYAQTELTHGSNVRGLNTKAVYDKTLFEGEGGWHIHTPSLEAMKWWPGGLAKSCNCCILMARIVIGEKDYGPHPFFFQVRDWNTHESLPGIELRDIGQKLGYNGMDNGGMRLTNVVLPRRNLLMKYTVVEKDGTYKKIGNDKMLFGTMTYTRLKISSMAPVNLAKACTTSIRYSAVRRQFAMQRVILGDDQVVHDDHSTGSGEVSGIMKSPGEDFDHPQPKLTAQEQLDLVIKPAKRSECQVLDYSSQQYLLFPQLALSFAMHFASMSAKEAYDKAILEFRSNKFDKLMEMHVLTSTLKAVSTVLAADGMEQCRKACGGHGYLNAAGIGPQFLSALPQATYEGDFVVLSIQVGQILLKAVSAKMLKGKTGNPNTPTLEYIYQFDVEKALAPPPATKKSEEDLMNALADPNFLMAALKKRANFIHFQTAETLQANVMKTGRKPDASTLDSIKIEMMKMTYAHAYVLYAGFFWDKLQSLRSQKTSNFKGSPKHSSGSATYYLYTSMLPLFELYCLTVMDTSYDKGGGLGEFLSARCFDEFEDRIVGKCITERIKLLLAKIRPQAVPIVDGWNFPDFLLNSCLGRYDGRVYEALYEQSTFEPLNKTDVTDGYHAHLQYILHPERAAAKGKQAKL